MLHSIVDYRKDPKKASAMANKFLATHTGQRQLRKTTQGWDLWRDGTESLVSLKELKDSYPVKAANFAKACGIDKEPAFAWWVFHTLICRNAILCCQSASEEKDPQRWN